MGTSVIVFPFDTFGNAGTGAGAQLLGDVLREAVEDTVAEVVEVRPHAYAEHLEIEEFEFATLEQLSGWRAAGWAASKSRLKAGDFTLWLSGNHLGVLPVYDALGKGDAVVQLDAHLDCYDLSDTLDTLSHGNFLAHVTAPRPVVINVGHRDLFLPADRVGQSFAAAIPAEQAAVDFPAVLAAVRDRTAKAKRVWLDIDVDAIDPAFAPAVHQPMPFGLTPQQVWALVDAVWTNKLAGVSISEFDPGRDVRDTTLNLLGWLAERIVLQRHGG